MMRTRGCISLISLLRMHLVIEKRMQNADLIAFASSYFLLFFYFLGISHHLVHVFFARRSDTSSHGAEKCMSFLKNERLHALDLGKIKKYLVALLLYDILMKKY